jgi:hypothetical protein
MKLVIDRSIRRAVAGKQSASKRLATLERLVGEGKPIPQSLLKASGTGRATAFAPYVALGLHHAKLDYSGSGGGDPLLVMQRIGDDTLVSIALTTHEDYATSDHARCRRWLWENRHAIDWSISQEAKLAFEALENEFTSGNPSPPGSKK